MNTNKPINEQIFRDGVSQRDRFLKALEPDYVSVDERDLSDLLTFVKGYATKLNYYDDSNQVNGDWSRFFPADVKQMVAYINNPESFANDESKIRQLSQPHLVLLFTFLQLLRYPQQQFKALTQRYLDFYYKKVLKLTKREEVSDRIHVFFELVQGEDTHLIKKGTLLNAGQDSQGINLNYATDEDIIVNQAQVASIKTLFVQRSNILKEEREKSGFDSMMKLALGHPNPGDSLPAMPNNYTTLIQLFNNLNQQVVIKYVNEQLWMSIEDFQKIMVEVQANTEDSNWEEVYRLVEQAENNKRNSSSSPISRTRIKNIYASSVVDVEKGQITLSKPFSPFANINFENHGIGFAISSPVLSLKEGDRTITLTLTCEENTLNSNVINEIIKQEPNPFEIYLSAEKEWIKVEPYDFTVGDSNSINNLQFKLTLASTQPAILPPKADESTFFLATPYPVVKILLKQIPNSGNSQEETFYYQQLQSIVLAKVNIQVDVENIQNIQLRNDSSVLNTKSPFQPFGNNPKVGSGFYFSYSEICQKKLDSLTLNIKWMGLPQNFGEYYKAYSDTLVIQPALANNSFKASLKLCNNRSWDNIEKEKIETEKEKVKTGQPLFSKDNNTLSNPIELNYKNFNIPGYSLETSNLDTDSDDPFEQSWYFKLELDYPDFGHDLYPIVLNKVALATDNNIKSLTVYPPYTPEVKAISLSYTASVEIDFKNSQDKPNPNQIFQIHPFGYADIQTLARNHSTDKKQYYLLPQYQEEGSLYIGIRNLFPPQNISFLFQMMAVSSNAELNQPQIQWSYLSGDSWVELKPKEILFDSTNGLVDAGIIRLSIPKQATSQHQLFPNGLHWLRATVQENATAIPDILDIKSQAVSATFINQGNTGEHLSKPLAANSIQGFVTREPAIKTVQQPYTSFGGKIKESDRAFTMRVSERLRHKQRAITAWDYERLVLEKFPQIYKVKCITSAVDSDNPGEAKVTVVVVPDISNTAPFFPLEPKAPLYLLKEIEANLRKYISPFVQIVVKNPRYERIKYRVSIRFLPGYEPGYYIKQLNEDIKRFLSPWAYEEQADITFGSSIHSSSVIHFIEKRPYIDYVANLKLIEQIDIKEDSQGKNVNQTNLAQVQHPDSILVSAPEHIIDLIGT